MRTFLPIFSISIYSLKFLTVKRLSNNKSNKSFTSIVDLAPHYAK